MPRGPRAIGVCYHVLNRGNNRGTLFHRPADYAAFISLIAEAQERTARPVRRLPHAEPLSCRSSSVRPTTWGTGCTGCSRRMQLAITSPTAPSAGVWQGRYKAFPIEQGEHLITVLRYVERNAVRANLVRYARDWKWGSASWRRGPRARSALLVEPPVSLPRVLGRLRDAPQTPAEVEELRACVNRQQPYGTNPDDTPVRGSGAARGRPRTGARVSPFPRRSGPIFQQDVDGLVPPSTSVRWRTPPRSRSCAAKIHDVPEDEAANPRPQPLSWITRTQRTPEHDRSGTVARHREPRAARACRSISASTANWPRFSLRSTSSRTDGRRNDRCSPVSSAAGSPGTTRLSRSTASRSARANRQRSQSRSRRAVARVRGASGRTSATARRKTWRSSSSEGGSMGSDMVRVRFRGARGFQYSGAAFVANPATAGAQIKHTVPRLN